MSRDRPRVFFDGGSRPNPGPIEVAVVICGAAYLTDDLGAGSNEDAEWLALIRAVELCAELDVRDAVLLGDARQIVTLAGAALRSGVADSNHAQAFLTACQQMRPARVRWIKRAQNLAGIALAARHPR